jgi:23S rRNA (guanosine2251-2'-O)-methyltransferase
LELLAAAPERLLEVWLDDHVELPEVARVCRELGVTPSVRRRDELAARAGGPELARGVLALARSPVGDDVDALVDAITRGTAAPTRPAGRHLIVALDGVVDPRNFGAILRCASYFGARGALWARDRAAPLSPVAVRASAGASERLPLVAVTNLVRAMEGLREHDFWSVGTVVDAEQDLRAAAADLPERLVVVFGREGDGLRRLVRERCDFLVRIDGAGGLGSLNVAAAAAVTLAMLS